MAINDNSLLATLKTTIGAMIDDSSAIGSEFTDNDVETLIYEGLKEMAINCSPQNTYLRTSASINISSNAGNLPSDYLFHDIGAVMQCTNDSNTELIKQEFDRAMFNIGKIDGRHFFIVKAKTIEVNGDDITVVLFEYIKAPTMLADSPITDEFESRMYNYLAHYVMAKLYLNDNSEQEQKSRALYHFMQFYKLIGHSSPKEEAESRV